jgi:ATP synthase subunit 6
MFVNFINFFFYNSPLDQFSVFIIFPFILHYSEVYPYLHHFFLIFQIFNYFWPYHEILSLISGGPVKYFNVLISGYESTIFGFLYANLFFKFNFILTYCNTYLNFLVFFFLFKLNLFGGLSEDIAWLTTFYRLSFINKYFNHIFYFYDINIKIFDHLLETDVIKNGFGFFFPKSKYSPTPLYLRLNVLFGSKMPFHTMYDCSYFFQVLFTLPYTVLRGVTVAFPDVTLHYFFFDLSITNISIILLLIFSILIIFFSVSYDITKHYIKPNKYQLIWDFFFKICLNMLKENIGKKGILFFPVIFLLFIFILFCNLLGMIPYSYTLTSHLLITFILAFIAFSFVNVLALSYHGIKFLNLFLPSGSPILLAPLLIPIEFISYSFRVISLAVRLFANMMAGHTLLKVIIGFSWSMLTSGGILFISHFIPLIVIFILIGLEIGVAIIQAYIFTILTCIYLSDGIHLH